MIDLGRDLIKIAASGQHEMSAGLARLGRGAVIPALFEEFISRIESRQATTPLSVGILIDEEEYSIHIADGQAVGTAGGVEDPLVSIRTDSIELISILYGPSSGAVISRFKSVNGSSKDLAKLEACLAEEYDMAELAVRYGSDKWDDHWYASYYDEYFRPWRFSPVTVLEIGVGGYGDPTLGGESLRMWKKYFTRGMIYGVDIVDKSSLNELRLRTFRGDQSDADFLSSVLEEIGPPDIVIDDGGHINSHVIESFTHLFPGLRPGGLYIIEDVQTSYWADKGGSSSDLSDPSTSMGFLKTLVDGLNYREFERTEPYAPSYTDFHVVGIHFYENLVFIRKRPEGARRDRHGSYVAGPNPVIGPCT
jgi:hypothetical protein